MDLARRIIVGCPVYERAWILPDWFTALEGWELPLEFVFAYTPGEDETLDVIHARSPGARIILADQSSGDHSTKRNWGQRSRIETLAMLRNALLDYVRAESPQYYLSLDSDVLVAPWEHSRKLFEHLEEDASIGAIAPLVYLGAGDIGNVFHWNGQHTRRLTRKQRYGVVQPVGVIAAAKVMTGNAYGYGEYGYHTQGEDIYWSDRMRQLKVPLAHDSSVVFRHVMSPDNLHVNDLRVPWSS